VSALTSSQSALRRELEWDDSDWLPAGDVRTENAMKFIDEPLEPFGEKLLELTLPTQVSLKTALVFRLVRLLAAKRCLPANGDPRAELCFDEAITNAMVHGNKLDGGRKLRIVVCADHERWGVIVEDQGDGFSAADVPDPNDLESALRESGRGIQLMDGYLDELTYARKGNCVLMVRRRQPEPDEAAAPPAVHPGATADAGADPVSVLREGDAEVIRVNASRLDEATTPVLDDAVQSTASSRLLLDLSCVTYMSSIGIRAIVRLLKLVASRQGRLIVTGLQPTVRNTLVSVRMLATLTVCPDREAGLAELLKRGGESPTQ
jgi:anti-anti-sigma factor